MFTESVRSFKFRCLAAALCATSLANAGEVAVTPGKVRVVGENPTAGVVRMVVKVDGTESEGVCHFEKKRKHPVSISVEYSLANPLLKPLAFDVIVASNTARSAEQQTVNNYGSAHYRTRLQTIPPDPTKVTVLEIVVAAEPKVKGLPIFLQKPQKKTITIVFDK